MISAIAAALPRIDTGLSAASAAPAGAAAGGASDFGAVLARVVQDAVGTVKNAETVSIGGINGQSSTQAVVDAVMSAERTLQTAVTIRDKVVTAYLELSRMAI